MNITKNKKIKCCLVNTLGLSSGDDMASVQGKYSLLPSGFSKSNDKYGHWQG